MAGCSVVSLELAGRAWGVSSRLESVTAGFKFKDGMVGLLGGVAGLTVFA